MKKTYTTPRLIVYGSVEEITLGCNKILGNGDGYTFNNQSIVCS